MLASFERGLRPRLSSRRSCTRARCSRLPDVIKQQAARAQQQPAVRHADEDSARQPGAALHELLRSAGRAAAALALSATLLLSPAALLNAEELHTVASYESAVRGRQAGVDQDGINVALFTDDAAAALESLKVYGRYVEENCERELACGPECTENREVLEDAWQIIANEHYSATNTFTQAGWGEQLLATLKAHDGLLPDKKALQSAVSSLLASLADPYSEFLQPPAFRRALRRPLPQEQTYLRAQYVGLGLELGPVCPEGGRLVLAPLPGSPAEAAGIARGDRLLSIDGTPVDQLGPKQLRGLMRGPAGSPATLEWVPAPTASAGAAAAAAATSAAARAAAAAAAVGPAAGAATLTPVSAAVGTAAPGVVLGGGSSDGVMGAAGVPVLGVPGFESIYGGVSGYGSGSYDAKRMVMDVERRDLPQPAVKMAQLPLGPPGSSDSYVTYVRLMFWASETTDSLAAVVQRLDRAPENAGYILDLRNNPGGVFEEAIASSGIFVREGATVAMTVRGPEEVIDEVWQLGDLPFPSPGPYTTKPVVLLGNRGTASASEVFAGALRDNGRAVLVGERTFGKGLVQHYFPLRDGKDGGIRVTVAKYLTPSFYDISAAGAGLIPDRACADFPRDGLPASLESADDCIRQAATLLKR
ncbi:hypothetical protein HYH03_012061 [Edaphochlamys debaryana]|uniref:PDZ domain-containing protein n=1 Tax=Edaphochlamys debaryana TaxID=47281 RepID=A0A835XSI3_9CHLO|nr:hypothetical protein HYH03_012061 [Edaphochlamys debaryana]|eukprot:KAG2489423.1 hypothetical protein HYH03_012061 [Edaphochlamys debaryana]